MDTYNRNDRPDKEDQTSAGGVDEPSGATILGTNITGINTAPFPGGIVAPGAELAAEEATDEGTAAADVGGLDQFASKPRETGDEAVSPAQKELEADELNG